MKFYAVSPQTRQLVNYIVKKHLCHGKAAFP